jgi:hypothetical protein
MDDFFGGSDMCDMLRKYMQDVVMISEWFVISCFAPIFDVAKVILKSNKLVLVTLGKHTRDSAV